ncbi:hypothetical protein B0H14DRAFT_2567176 [Mycena olivaceomarginata]|nr:hypothetical protein B0H14DRAFT_2567176 [Mycena olivaceomarginata]
MSCRTLSKNNIFGGMSFAVGKWIQLLAVRETDSSISKSGSMLARLHEPFIIRSSKGGGGRSTGGRDVDTKVVEEEKADKEEDGLNMSVADKEHGDLLNAELAQRCEWRNYKHLVAAAQGQHQQQAQRNPGLALAITNTNTAAAAAVTNDSAAHRYLSFRVDQDGYDSDDSGSNYSTSAGVKEEMLRKQELQDEEDVHPNQLVSFFVPTTVTLKVFNQPLWISKTVFKKRHRAVS